MGHIGLLRVGGPDGGGPRQADDRESRVRLPRGGNSPALAQRSARTVYFLGGAGVQAVEVRIRRPAAVRMRRAMT
jgi:hypothetical protein